MCQFIYKVWVVILFLQVRPLMTFRDSHWVPEDLQDTGRMQNPRGPMWSTS